MELGFALQNTVMYVAQLFLASWTPMGLMEAKKEGQTDVKVEIVM